MANYEQIHQISGAVHNSDQFDDIIDAIKSCKYYAYIYHDSDTNESGDIVPKHLHFVCDDRHSMSKWSKLLGIPEHMIVKVRNFRSMNRYLIHKDNPEKHQYSPDDIVTNLPIRFRSYLVDNQEIDTKRLFYDIYAIRYGRISINEFVDKYQYFIAKQSFLSQYKIISDLVKNYSFSKENFEK